MRIPGGKREWRDFEGSKGEARKEAKGQINSVRLGEFRTFIGCKQFVFRPLTLLDGNCSNRIKTYTSLNSEKTEEHFWTRPKAS